MKIKVSETTTLQLDWLVAKCEGWVDANEPLKQHDDPDERLGRFNWAMRKNGLRFFLNQLELHFSTSPAQGQPILEREGIATRRHSNGTWYAMLSSDLGNGERAQWSQFTFKNVPSTASTSRKCRFDGHTMLIAGLRCYVASKLGDEVEVPDKLKCESLFPPNI